MNHSWFEYRPFHGFGLQKLFKTQHVPFFFSSLVLLPTPSALAKSFKLTQTH